MDDRWRGGREGGKRGRGHELQFPNSNFIFAGKVIMESIDRSSNRSISLSTIIVSIDIDISVGIIDPDLCNRQLSSIVSAVTVET